MRGTVARIGAESVRLLSGAGLLPPLENFLPPLENFRCLYAAITHHSFNSGADDRCRSVAHNSCQRLALGLAFLRLLRLRLSVLRLCRLPSLLRLWFRLPGLWLWLWERLLRRLQIRLSPRPASLLRCVL